MNSTSNTQQSEMTTAIKTKTLLVRLPVKVYYETEVDYDQFYEKWMPNKKDGESDEAYENRTLLTWKYLTGKNCIPVELDEVDEGECNEDGTDPLQYYGDAEEEFKDICRCASEMVERKMKRQEDKKE